MYAIVEKFADALAAFVFYPSPSELSGKLPIVIIILLLAAIYFTLRFRFAQFRYFKLAIQTVSGKFTRSNQKGAISHFQALSAAVSGTVGLGNIAGVAIAISIGGPGATFWMILAGLLGMATKFVECTLAVKYRTIDEDGKIYGSPSHYLKKGLGEKGMHKLGKILATFFAIMCVAGSFGGGNLFQVNQMVQQLTGQLNWTHELAPLFLGIFFAVAVGLVIVGGIQRIGAVAEKIVPTMCGIYILMCLTVLFFNLSLIPQAAWEIVTGAFTGSGMAGGAIGALVVGIRRAVGSNESGLGSAPIAHAAVKTDYPASEGVVALLEPFIDTVVICTLTALVIIITGEYHNFQGETSTMVGVTMTSNAFGKVLSFFPAILTLAVTLFAFSTMVTWSYYGLQSWVYLVGKGKNKELLYKLVFCSVIVLGAIISLDSVVKITDSLFFLMLLPNLIGLVFLTPVVAKELKIFLKYTESFRDTKNR